MSAAEEPTRSEVLEKVLKSLESIRASPLPPANWDRFEQVLAAIVAAMDRDDVTALRNGRVAIDRLNVRQQNVAKMDKEPSIEQPDRPRSASDNLSKRIKDELAAKEREKRR